MKYGKAIKTIRTGRGLSQLDLSKILDKTPSYISKIEKEERTPSIEFIELFTKKLKIPSYLFMLLASEKNDLKGLEKKDIEKISKNLLKIVFDLDIEKSSK